VSYNQTVSKSDYILSSDLIVDVDNSNSSKSGSAGGGSAAASNLANLKSPLTRDQGSADQEQSNESFWESFRQLNQSVLLADRINLDVVDSSTGEKVSFENVRVSLNNLLRKH